MKRLAYKLLKKEIEPLRVNYMDPKETINYLVNNPHMSLARIGDGEIAVFLGGDIYFQKFSSLYKKEFLQMFKDNNKNLLIGIPAFEISKTRQELVDIKYNPSYWETSKILFKYLLKTNNTTYGSYNISSAFRDDFSFISRLWKGKNVIIVGGVSKYFKDKKLKEAEEQIVIDSPEENAMSDFFNIYNDVKNTYNKMDNCVVLIGCGPCATILSYWLSKENIISYDLGHFFDINEGVW